MDNLVRAIQKIKSEKGNEILSTSQFVGMLKDYQAFEDEEPYTENVLTQIVNGGFVKDILSWKGLDSAKYANEADALAYRISTKYATQQDAALAVINKLSVGLGIIKSVPKQFSKQQTQTTTNTSKSNNNNGNVNSSCKNNPFIPPQDTPLPYMTNGSDCTKKGYAFIDTEIPITKKTSVMICFNAAKWDGPIAGFIVEKNNGWPEGSTYFRWEMSMYQHKLIFNCPIIQEKQINCGTFLPNKDYIIQTCNCFAFVCKNDKENVFDTITLLKNSVKAGLMGMQAIPYDWNETETIKLFGSFGSFRDERAFAWQGLKIMFFKATEGNTLVADMIPVLHKGIPCMYDRIRNQYFNLKKFAN